MNAIKRLLQFVLFRKKRTYISYQKNISNTEILNHFERDNYNIISKKTITNSITASYQKKKWTEERLFLDGIQNHLPADSGATWFDIQIKTKNDWFNHNKIHELKDEEIKAVRFVDNGRGFVAEELEVLSSDKHDKQGAHGQFGEGLKMISATCIRLGMKMIIESRNWQATPRYQNIQLTDRVDQQLVFDINYFDNSIKGSTTTIHNPNKKLLEIIRNIGSYLVIILEERYQPKLKLDVGDILEIGNRHFINGVYFPSPNIETLFSYNLKNINEETINRDRDHIDIHEFEKNVIQILTHLDDPELIKAICLAGIKNKNFKELEILQEVVPQNPEIYIDALKNIVDNNKIFIQSSSFPSIEEKIKEKRLNRLGYTCIENNKHSFVKFLKKCGVPTANDLIKDEDHKTPDEEEISTSFTLEYVPLRWNEERVMIDAIQNHLPSDSNGNFINIDIEINEEWLSLHEFEKIVKINHELLKEATAIRIRDNGKGYPVEFLGLAYSNKIREITSGMHGEGLKLLSAMALKLGMSVKLRSRDWEATADEKALYLDNEHIKQLKFQIKRNLPDIKGSETVISKITYKFAEEILLIRENVLHFASSYRPIAKNKIGEIVNIGGGRIYVKGNKVTDEEKDNLLFSYNFLDNFGFDCRDRDQYALRVLQEKIKDLFYDITNKECIKHFLISASKKMGQKVEYQKFKFSEEAQNAWFQSFTETFGKKAVIGTSPITIIEATNIGYDVITFPNDVGNNLIACKVLKDTDVLIPLSYKSVPINDLSVYERNIFKLHLILDEVLGVTDLQKKAKIVIFEIAYGINDVPLIGLLGQWRKDQNTIYIQRRQLQNKKSFLSTFAEERAHQMSNAPDYSRELVTFLTNTIADFTLKIKK